MRLAVAASPEVAIPTLEALAASSHELVRIISQPDKPAGRGKVLTATPVSQWALSHGYQLLRPTTDEEIAEAVSDVDSVITIGFGVLLPEKVLEIPPHGFLNLHFSLLPRWRGAAPVQRAIEAGDQLTGVTVFQLDAGMDTGPIYTVHRYALDSDITSDELLKELGEVGAPAVLEALEKISQGVRPVPQSQAGATKAHKLSRDEARINWGEEAGKVSAKIRAFTSSPGAWTTFRGNTIKVASPTISDITLNAGEIALMNKKLYIGTSTQALEIGSITSAGKGAINGPAWANGARLQRGEICE